MIVIATVY